MKNRFDVFSTNVISIYLLSLPTLFLINNLVIPKIRFVLTIVLFIFQIVYVKYPKKNEINVSIILLILMSIIYGIRKEYVYFIYIPPLIVFVHFFYLFNSKSTNVLKKIEYARLFLFGILIAAIIGLTYMYTSGVYVKGGEYNENSWVISNIYIPILLGISTIYIYYSKIYKSKFIYSFIYIIAIIFILITLVFLEKRLPIVCAIISIVIINNFWQRKTFINLIVLILLLYPIYSTFLLQIITPITESDLFVTIFKRNDDLLDVSINGRVIRIIAALEFISNIQFVNLFYYPTEIVLSTDIVHNHFHNLILQLYYERGAISVVSFLIILFKSMKNYTLNSTSVSPMLKSIILYLILIGTNESVLGFCSMTEFCTFSFILITLGISDDIQNAEVQNKI